MKIVSITLLISLMPIIGICQEHFIFEGSNWYFSDPDDTLGNPMADYTFYEYVKDTLFEGENCKFIHSSAGDHKIFLEKDDKVYYYAHNRFQLLYDFDVKVNDTIYLDMWTMTFLLTQDEEFIIYDTILSVKSIVKVVDSIAVDDYYLRKVFVDIFPESEILEYAVWPSGFEYFEFLGDPIDGIIPLLIKGMGPAINTNRNLRCYSDTRFFFMPSYWQQFGKDCDFRITSVVELGNDTRVTVYPNPVSDVLTIRLPDNYPACTIKLMDYLGRVILSQDYYMPDSSEIRIGYLDPGLYILIVKNPETRFIQTFKILKN